MHVDADAFFVSVERALNPELNDRAVIVGGTKDDFRGVVASASYEARAKGVRSAMPIVQAARLCPEAVFLRGRRHAYVEYSRRIMAILRECSPAVQAVSLDDFYLDATGLDRLHGPPLALGRKIKERTRGETGVTVTVGIATSRLVAKVASESVKPDGLIQIPPGDEAAFLAPLDVRDLPGVGPSASAALYRRGLRAIGQVAAMAPERLERMFGKWARDLWLHARGIDDTPVRAEDGPAKSVSHETTFDRDTADAEFLEGVARRLAERVCARLRRGGLAARTVSVKVKFADFRSVSAAKTLPAPTNHDHEVAAAAAGRLESLLRGGARVRLIGVVASNLCDAAARQTDFLTEEERQRRERLYKGIDAVRGKQGFDAIRAGRSLLFEKRPEAREREDLGRKE